MEETVRISFDYAWNLSEQIITLATLVLGFTATFAKEFKTNSQNNIVFISIAWGLYLVSILFGLLSFMALTGALSNGPPSAIPPNARAFAGVQIVTFGLASIMVAITGWRVYQSR